MSLEQLTFPPAPSAPSELSGSLKASLNPICKAQSHLEDNTKRDSGLAPSVSTMTPDAVPDASQRSSALPNNVPSIQLNGDTSPSPPSATVASHAKDTQLPVPTRSLTSGNRKSSHDGDFTGITTSIPSGDFSDPFASSLTFSNRGSVLLDGKKASALFGPPGSRASQSAPTSTANVPTRTVSLADRRLSQRLRMLYERGDENAIVERITEDPAEEEAERLSMSTKPQSGNCAMGGEKYLSLPEKQPWEAAGGIEDWRDVGTGDVDRYGFIKPRSTGTRTPSNISQASGSQAASPPQLPGRKLARSPPDASKNSRLSILNPRPKSGQSSRPPSRAASRAETQAPSITSVRSRKSVFSRHSTINRGRSWADEAPHMLTTTEGFPGSSPEKRQDVGKQAIERRREAKWAEMALSTPQSAYRKHGENAVGGGERFSFDISDKKLIERTWKGIPDRWRASAWYSFLTTSARRNGSKQHPFIDDDELVRRYIVHQDSDCSDDMQIDMDVPRTISGHVMFRARYRGGQRLMFRVLRGLALEFPETGYVQGMAPLIATLLCYYDEERAFVVACRMWEHRGLAELFKPGFVGLMRTLDVFEKDWLGRVPAKATFDELGIPPMSYGTKWYLTLFCYSLPFAAQLRVWDVFILLGGGEGGIDGAGARRHETVRAFSQHVRSTESTLNDTTGAGQPISPLAKHGFDALHAVSAAIIDGLQEGLVGSDFENAMKLVTSAVPIGREDVLMRVVKREWKEQKRAR